jgi:hypothetical protein
MAVMNANLQAYDEMDDFTPIPPGEYEVEVTDSEVAIAKSSGNNMAVFQFTVLGPMFAGRKVWDRFVLSNDIALRRLKTFAKFAGHKNCNFIKDTEELHGLRVKVKLAIEQSGDYDPKNVIKAFKPVNGTITIDTPPVAPTVPTPPPTPPEAPPSAAKPKFPWDR